MCVVSFLIFVILLLLLFTIYLLKLLISLLAKRKRNRSGSGNWHFGGGGGVDCYYCCCHCIAALSSNFLYFSLSAISSFVRFPFIRHNCFSVWENSINVLFLIDSYCNPLVFHFSLAFPLAYFFICQSQCPLNFVHMHTMYTMYDALFLPPFH